MKTLAKRILGQFVNPAARRFGFEIVRYGDPGAKPDYPVDFSPADVRILEAVRPFTMTTNENLKVLIDAIRYVSAHRLPGAMVECGVWRGGSSMAIALTLLEGGDNSRDLYLYDTFTGMNQPEDVDRFPDGTPAHVEFERTKISSDTSTWCSATLDDVTANLRTINYPMDRIRFVKGKVEDTIPGVVPDQIALLRLDTDWYASTRHELEHLFHRLVPHGVLIVDDYGYWAGARKAVDEFIQRQNLRLYLHRADQSSRVIINCSAAGSSGAVTEPRHPTPWP